MNHNNTQIFIGQNHTGSWSFYEAIQGITLQNEFIEIDAYTVAPNVTDLPPLMQDIQTLREYIDSSKITPKFIYTHRPIPAHLALEPSLQKNATYVTLLRDPVSRFLSCYFWLVKHKHANVHWVPEIIKEGVSLEEWLDYLVANNLRPGGMWPGEYFYQAWIDSSLVPENIGKKRYDVVNYVLDQYFSFIGITELFDESLYIFAKKFGYKSLPTWKLLGNTDRPSNSQISPKILEKIEELMPMDRRIYEKFKASFLERYAEDIAYFRENIKTLRATTEVNLNPIV